MNILKLLGIGGLVVGVGGGLIGYWKYSSLYPSTQDAYVQAHVIVIAPEVTGKVTALHVTENQFVKAGDPLFDIEGADYESITAQARAQVDAAGQAIESYQQQIDAAAASVESTTSADDAAKAQLARVQQLFDDGNAAQATLDQNSTAAAATDANLRTAQATLAQARAAAIANQDTLLSAQATLQLAEQNLSRTSVTAPVDGWIANITLREGSVVTAYTPVFSIVDNSEWWVEANFKETDMSRIEVGQPVTFTVDMIPDADMTGQITSIGRGSGSTFALLPAENASGNWVKVTQRFTVRIALDSIDPDLRVGASADVTVDTSDPDQ